MVKKRVGALDKVDADLLAISYIPTYLTLTITSGRVCSTKSVEIHSELELPPLAQGTC